MNTTARFPVQTVSSRSVTLSAVFANITICQTFLMMAVLMTALGVVYVTNFSRNLHAGMQQLLVERNQLQLQWGQLLLEKSAWTVQTRVQSVAEESLGMMVPDNKSVVIIKE